jgi:hypothetical protein
MHSDKTQARTSARDLRRKTHADTRRDRPTGAATTHNQYIDTHGTTGQGGTGGGRPGGPVCGDLRGSGTSTIRRPTPNKHTHTRTYTHSTAQRYRTPRTINQDTSHHAHCHKGQCVDGLTHAYTATAGIHKVTVSPELFIIRTTSLTGSEDGIGAPFTVTTRSPTCTPANFAEPA